MNVIRTFSSLESRSDYLFYLDIQILIARNENSQYYGLLTMISAFLATRTNRVKLFIDKAKHRRE